MNRAGRNRGGGSSSRGKKIASSEPVERRERPTNSAKKRRLAETSQKKMVVVEEEKQSSPSSVNEKMSKDQPCSSGEESEGDEVFNEGIFEELDPNDGWPMDRSVIVDYGTHIARSIWNGTLTNRILRVRRSSTRVGDLWSLEKESLAVQNYVLRSGLGSIASHPRRYVDFQLVSALVERFYPETNTFHMPFGEMTITLDDVKHITGLPVTGKPVIGEGNKVELVVVCNWVKKGLGVSEAQAVDALGSTRGFNIKLGWLYDEFAFTSTGEDKKNPKHVARAYLLYLLGSTIFQDKSGISISAYYLQLLLDLDTVGEYNWGAAALAFLYRHLGKATREKVKQICGHTDMLEAWANEHFYLGWRISPNFVQGDPRISKWASVTQPGDKEMGLVGFRERLDELNAWEVTWDPYAHCRDLYPMQEITWYTGCLICYDIAEAYNPSRVVRQMGRVQSIPPSPIRASQATRFVHNVFHGQLEGYRSHLLEEKLRGPVATHPWQYELGYVEWFRSISHPYVQPPAIRQTHKLRGADEVFYNMMRKIDAAVNELSIGNLSSFTPREMNLRRILGCEDPASNVVEVEPDKDIEVEDQPDADAEILITTERRSNKCHDKPHKRRL